MNRELSHTAVRAAVDAFQAGEPVLIHDSGERENETDLVYPADAIDPECVAHLRTDAGGLICVALPSVVADAFELPFLQDALSHPVSSDVHLDYDDRSSFSLPVNHTETRTGITDVDRSQTITQLARAATMPESIDFSAEFSAPGHVPLLRAADDLLETRRGHTELGVALATRTDRSPAVVVCEMLNAETGTALSTEKARQYATNRDLTFVEGAAIVDALA